MALLLPDTSFKANNNIPKHDVALPPSNFFYLNPSKCIYSVVRNFDYVL